MNGRVFKLERDREVGKSGVEHQIDFQCLNPNSSAYMQQNQYEVGSSRTIKSDVNIQYK